jgi:uncharacterized protein YciI
MKHFLVELTYLASLEKINETTPEHRAFLAGGYERGWLLFSGPQVPRTGGLVVARAPSLQDLQELFSHDPYYLKNLASYRFVEFDPVRRQEFMADWIAGK